MYRECVINRKREVMEAGNKMMDSMRFDSDESDDNGNGNMLDGLGSGKPKKTEAKKANPIER